VPSPTPRYNIAPSQPISAIAQQNTAREKRSFRTAFKSRRCLIVAAGFCEWQKVAPAKKGSKKQPYYIQMGDQSLFGMAGLWETWESGDGSYLESCTAGFRTRRRGVCDRWLIELS